MCWKDRYVAALAVAAKLPRAPAPTNHSTNTISDALHAVVLWQQSWMAFEHALPTSATPSSTLQSSPRVVFLASTVEVILSFQTLTNVQQVPLCAGVAPADVPPCVSIMSRWTCIITWIMQSLMAAPHGDRWDDVIQAADSVALLARRICPLRADQLAADVARHYDTNHMRSVSWGMAETALAQSRAALLSDNFRVSFQFYDTQASNDHVLASLDQLLTSPHATAVSHPEPPTTATPVSATLEPILKNIACIAASPCCPHIVAYMTEVMYQLVSTFSWRFSSGWLAAAIFAMNAEQCLSGIGRTGFVVDCLAGLMVAARSALELLVTTIIDHLSSHVRGSIEVAVQQRKSSSSDSLWKPAAAPSSGSAIVLAPLVREALISFLVYVWEPLASCLVRTVNTQCDPSANGEREQVVKHRCGGDALVETLMCSAVSMFASELISAAGDRNNGGSKKPLEGSSTVARLAAAIIGINTLQRLIAGDRRISDTLKASVLEVLAMSR